MCSVHGDVMKLCPILLCIRLVKKQIKSFLYWKMGMQRIRERKEKRLGVGNSLGRFTPATTDVKCQGWHSRSSVTLSGIWETFCWSPDALHALLMMEIKHLVELSEAFVWSLNPSQGRTWAAFELKDGQIKQGSQEKKGRFMRVSWRGPVWGQSSITMPDHALWICSRSS